MARASFARRGKTFPAYLHTIDTKLRKFRQMIDELADIDGGLQGGLVTLPVLHALSTHPRSVALRQHISEIWNGNATGTQVGQFLEESNTSQWMYGQAMCLYDDAMSELDEKLDSKGDGYRKLFEYKRSKLESLLNK
jgi:hypothetical protein